MTEHHPESINSYATMFSTTIVFPAGLASSWSHRDENMHEVSEHLVTDVPGLSMSSQSTDT